LIVFNNPNPNWGNIADIWRDVSETAATKYNNTLSGEGLVSEDFWMSAKKGKIEEKIIKSLNAG
jgi:hypothetical protein